MTAAEFVERVQGYYGAYPVGQRRDLKEYLTGLSGAYLEALYCRLVRGYSSKWGKAPDIATLEEYRGEVLAELASAPPPLRPAITDGSEVDCREDIARLFAELRAAKRFGLEPAGGVPEENQDGGSV